MSCISQLCSVSFQLGVGLKCQKSLVILFYSRFMQPVLSFSSVQLHLGFTAGFTLAALRSSQRCIGADSCHGRSGVSPPAVFTPPHLDAQVLPSRLQHHHRQLMERFLCSHFLAVRNVSLPLKAAQLIISLNDSNLCPALRAFNPGVPQEPCRVPLWFKSHQFPLKLFFFYVSQCAGSVMCFKTS